MPDYPAEIRKAAADAVFSLNIHGSALKGMDTRQEAEAIAAAVLDAVARQLGDHVAGKIAAHRDEWAAGKPGAGTRGWRWHLGVAARVASRAFLTEDDLRRIAARELAAGNYAACPAPEDNDAARLTEGSTLTATAGQPKAGNDRKGR